MTHLNIESVIVILGGVLILITTILTYFLVNALKKIDLVERMEEKLLIAIAKLDEVSQEVKSLFKQSVNTSAHQNNLQIQIDGLDQRIKALEEDVQGLKRRAEN